MRENENFDGWSSSDVWKSEFIISFPAGSIRWFIFWKWRLGYSYYDVLFTFAFTRPMPPKKVNIPVLLYVGKTVWWKEANAEMSTKTTKDTRSHQKGFFILEEFDRIP